MALPMRQTKSRFKKNQSRICKPSGTPADPAAPVEGGRLGATLPIPVEKCVPHGADGFDELRLARIIIQFPAKRGNVDIDGAV